MTATTRTGSADTPRERPDTGENTPADETPDGAGPAPGAPGSARRDARLADRGRPAWQVLLLMPAGVALAAVDTVLLFRAFDVDGTTPVPQTLAFLPWLLVPAGGALLLAGPARWWTGAAWAAVTLGALGWFLQPYGPDRTGAEGPAVAHLRVLSSNVEFGQGTAELIPAIRREKPDLVFVQECDHACSAALTARLPRADYPYRSAVEASGAEGSVILSRHPLRPTRGVAGQLGMPGAVADVEGHAVRLQLAHPLPPMPGRLGAWRSELGALRDFAAKGQGGATILAGDFNASQDHAAFRRILDTGLHDSARLTGDARTPTWPADTAPTLGTQIDHVLVSDAFTVRDTRFLDLADTDHRSLITELTLHAPRGSEDG